MFIVQIFVFVNHVCHARARASNGPNNTFTHADKPDKTFTQTGIVWLTQLAAGVSAERPKLVKLATDRYIALWEEWSYEGTTLTYKATKSLLIDEQGQVVRAETPIAARLNPSGADRAFALNGAAAWITSAADPAKLTLHTVDANLVLVTTPGRSHRAAAWSCRTTATS